MTCRNDTLHALHAVTGQTKGVPSGPVDAAGIPACGLMYRSPMLDRPV